MVYRSSEMSGEDPKPHNAFRNDGSFLEMFKKMQEQAKAAAGSSGGSLSADSGEESKSSDAEGTDRKSGSSKPVPLFGKRRGGRVLPTGKVKKLKPEDESSEESPKDAWAVYLAEVKRYKETTCEEDGKTRPLVK